MQFWNCILLPPPSQPFKPLPGRKLSLKYPYHSNGLFAVRFSRRPRQWRNTYLPLFLLVRFTLKLQARKPTQKNLLPKEGCVRGVKRSQCVASGPTFCQGLRLQGFFFLLRFTIRCNCKGIMSENNLPNHPCARGAHFQHRLEHHHAQGFHFSY